MPKNLYSSPNNDYIKTTKLWRKTYEFRRRRKNHAFDIVCQSTAFTGKEPQVLWSKGNRSHIPNRLWFHTSKKGQTNEYGSDWKDNRPRRYGGKLYPKSSSLHNNQHRFRNGYKIQQAWQRLNQMVQCGFGKLSQFPPKIHWRYRQGKNPCILSDGWKMGRGNQDWKRQCAVYNRRPDNVSSGTGGFRHTKNHQRQFHAL